MITKKSFFAIHKKSHVSITLKETGLENIVGQGENAGNQHFLLVWQCFFFYIFKDKFQIISILEEKKIKIYSYMKNWSTRKQKEKSKVSKNFRASSTWSIAIGIKIQTKVIKRSWLPATGGFLEKDGLTTNICWILIKCSSVLSWIWAVSTCPAVFVCFLLVVVVYKYQFLSRSTKFIDSTVLLFREGRQLF